MYFNLAAAEETAMASSKAWNSVASLARVGWLLAGGAIGASIGGGCWLKAYSIEMKAAGESVTAWKCPAWLKMAKGSIGCKHEDNSERKLANAIPLRRKAARRIRRETPWKQQKRLAKGGWLKQEGRENGGRRSAVRTYKAKYLRHAILSVISDESTDDCICVRKSLIERNVRSWWNLGMKISVIYREEIKPLFSIKWLIKCTS